MCFTNDGNFGAFQGFSSQRWVLMWVWRVRSSPSVRQRRRDRSRKHRSLWPSHPASAYPRCLRITQQNRGRERDRVKPKLPKATLWLPPAGCERKVSQVGATVSAPSLVPQLWALLLSPGSEGHQRSPLEGKVWDTNRHELLNPVTQSGSFTIWWRSLGSLSRAMMSAHWLTNSSSSSEFYSRTQLQRLHQLQVEKYSQITKWTKWERSTATGEWKRFLWTGAGAICVTLVNKLRCWQEQ